jgi:NifU-like protein involved in Fe-S cluster formation
MPESLDILYHKQMLALTQRPVFYVGADILQSPACLRNPMCGDALCFGYHQQKIHWHGEGCLICLASAEALCQTLDMVDDNFQIDTLCTQIQDYFNGFCDMLTSKFLPLSSVKQVKSRIKCVILATQCVKKLIKGSY